MITPLNSFKLFTAGVICDMISAAGTMLSVSQTDNIAYIVNFVTQYQEEWNKCRGDEQTLNELKYKIILHFTNEIYANPSASLHKLYTALAIKNIQNEIMSKNANISQTFGEYIYPIPLADGVCLEMIKVKAGTFMMGSSPSECWHRNDELLHSVTLTKKFWIAKNPVPVEQYNCIAGTAYKDDKESCMVNWYDAQKFCDILNDRYADFLPSGYMFALPTEAQWECACRASVDTTKIENRLKELYDVRKYYIQEEEKLCCLPYVVADMFFRARLAPIIELAYRRFDELRWSSLLLDYPQWCRDWYEAEYSADPEFLTRNRGTEKVIRGMGTYSYRRRCFPPLNNCPRLAKRDKCDPSQNIATFRIAIVPMLECTV